MPIAGMTRVRLLDGFKMIPREGLGHVAVGLLPTEKSREKAPYPARGCGIVISAHTHEPGIPSPPLGVGEKGETADRG